MFQELLNKWRIKCDEKTILAMWNESQRSYHSLSHLDDLIDQINKDHLKYTERQYEKLILSALFHDVVYDPLKFDNEEKSAEFFLSCCEDKNNPDILEVHQIILDTKTHESSTPLSENFSKYDMSIVERKYEDLLEWENGIHEEYESYGEMYKPARLKFLESVLDKYPQNTDNLLKLIDYVKTNYQP